MDHAGRSFETSVEIAASASKLWACWTDPDALNAWYTLAASGDPRPGSTYTWQFDPFFGPAQVLRVQEVEPGLSILFALGEQLLAIRIRPEGARTSVDLIHAGFGPEGEDEVRYEGCRSGWQLALAQLKFYVENYSGQRRLELLALQPIASLGPQVHTMFADPKLRRRWMQLPDPPRDVLADSGSELLLRWDAIGGTLECKQFAWGAQNYLCLRASSWSSGYDLGSHRPAFEHSLSLLHSLVR